VSHTGRTRIAVDAMGGDFAPGNIVAGALDALRETHYRFDIVLVGPEHVVHDELERFALRPDERKYCMIINADQIVDMHDEATAVLRSKRNSSIAVGMTLHRERHADAFVSAGHTGAMMTASTLILGRIEGVGRPTIGAFFPSERGVCLVLDAGTNVDCKPQHLYEFALMGSIYSSTMFGIERPSVGLLNIGEEESKGSDVVREAYRLLKASTLNFVGNVEGRDILQGKANVVVCDGFVGNVILKFGESVPAFFKNRLKAQVQRNIITKVVGLAMRSTLRGAFKSMDYEEYGGVPVLGVNGVSIIGHGKSTPKAIKNMILRAEEMVLKNINEQIQQALAAER
jgi:glycerol-3-phosphate acyltransferase PlsX